MALTFPGTPVTLDPLSDVLRAVRLTGAYFYMVEATHPWSVLTVEATKLAPRVHPASEHLVGQLLGRHRG